jgi:hypothetical protein
VRATAPDVVNPKQAVAWSHLGDRLGYGLDMTRAGLGNRFSGRKRRQRKKCRVRDQQLTHLRNRGGLAPRWDAGRELAGLQARPPERVLL